MIALFPQCLILSLADSFVVNVAVTTMQWQNMIHSNRYGASGRCWYLQQLDSFQNQKTIRFYLQKKKTKRANWKIIKRKLNKVIPLK